MNKKSTVFDCSIFQFPKVHSLSGNITPINNDIEIPFAIQRIYYLYDVPGGESRGGHAHKNLKQFIIAASGSFDVTLDDGNNKKTVQLNRSYLGLYIIPGIWRDISNFSSGAICLVLASAKYDEDDYIRDYSDFISKKHNL